MSSEIPPLWVRLGLWSIKIRKTAIIYLIISIVSGISAGIFWHPIWFGMFAAAAWYWLSIRWMDQNAGWAARAG